MKPLIGITMNLEERAARSLNILDQDYGKAVLQAGGIPVPVLGIKQSIADIMRQLNGFLFTGGDDISLFEIETALNYLQQLTGSKAEIVMGITYDKRMQDRVQVILVITGMGAPTLEEDNV